jgi:hypothetical protein
MLNRNQENMPVKYHLGLKILFEGYLINKKLLCSGYVMGGAKNQLNSLKINCFLCDVYMIFTHILFDNHLIKVKI